MKEKLTSRTKRTRKNLLIFVFILIANFSDCGFIHAQGWQWAKSHGGSLSDFGVRTCNDAAGNTFVAGIFSSSVMSAGSLTVSNVGLEDAYITKYDPNGNPLWIKVIGGIDNEEIGGICTDANGNVYLTGAFSSPVIGAAPFAINKSSTGGDPDIFVIGFDPLGNALWLKGYGDTGKDRGADCVYSNAQSALYVVGYYSSASLAFSSFTITNTSSNGDADLFVLKLDASANPLWAVTTGEEFSQDLALHVGLDASNSYPYISGILYGSPTSVIGTTTLTNNYAGANYFLAKCSDTGIFQWALNGGSLTGESNQVGLAVDAANNCYIAGDYDGVSMSIPPLTLTNSGQKDVFVAKYNPSGTLIWANQISNGSQEELAGGLAVDANNNIYVGGSYTGSVVTIGTTSFTNTSTGFDDIFLAKYNSAGNFQWATTATGSDIEKLNDISLDVNGNIYATGNYNIVGPTAFGTTTLNSVGVEDAFLAKIGCLTPTISGVQNICAGTSATLTASGATSYTWSTGAITSTIIITPTNNAVYSVMGAIGTCSGVSTNFSVTVLPASINAGPNLNLLCNQSQIINATTNPPNPTSVTWTPTSGLSNSNILTPSVIATASSTQYTVFVNLNNGCVVSDAVTITQYAPTPSICMVTVDSVGINNLILWDKAAYPSADTFYVYRDIANSNYQLIGKVLSSVNFGEFQDTVRSLYSANGDPKIASWKYKIAYKDTCGNLSAMSLFHKTLFIQNTNGNFLWNDYQIEGQTTPVPALNNYIFRRDNSANGNWLNVQILNPTANSYTDPNYNSFTTTADWRVETNWTLQCNSSYLKNNSAAIIKRSKSNIINNRTNSLHEINIENYISIYPNPANSFINVELDLSIDYSIVIQNNLGQVIYLSKYNNGNKKISTDKFAKGFYNLRVETPKGSSTKKIIIE